MKKIAFIALVGLAVSCNKPAQEENAQPAASAVTLPYTASYSSQFTDEIPDADLLVVLNSYKAWEDGDMNALHATLGDTLTFISWKGVLSSGPTQEITRDWSTFRDSLSSVKIQMNAWRKKLYGRQERTCRYRLV